MARSVCDRVLRLSKTLMSRSRDKYVLCIPHVFVRVRFENGRTETSKRPLYPPSHRLQRERRIRRGVAHGHLSVRGDRTGPLDGNLRTREKQLTTYVPKPHLGITNTACACQKRIEWPPPLVNSVLLRKACSSLTSILKIKNLSCF